MKGTFATTRPFMFKANESMNAEVGLCDVTTIADCYYERYNCDEWLARETI